MGKNKFNNRKKKRNQKSKPKKERKTYSLYSNKDQRRNFGTKRKVEEVNEDVRNEKRKKEYIENTPETFSSDSDDNVDNMQQLLSTFKHYSNEKKIESSEDESGDDLNDSFDEEDFVEKSDYKDKNELIETNQDDEEIEINDDVETQNEDNDLESCQDPFSKHLLFELSPNLLNSVQNLPITSTTTIENWSKLNRLIIQIPQCNEESKSDKNVTSNTILERKIFALPGEIPKKINLNKETYETLFIKSQIKDNLIRSNTSLSSNDKLKSIPLTSLQGEIFSIINNYQDFYFPGRTFDNAEEIRFVYCLHVVNHILKTRTKVLHHNARLSKKDDVPEEFRDQGLVRPKILIIVPFKSSAYKIIQLLINILITEDKGNVINKNRFIEDYTGNELQMPKKNPKPEDYELTFSGNTSDDFKIGITVTKKSLKLYAAFYSSDIIVASPLGLRTIIGAEGESERDFDFLASIELLIFDQMELFLMQNWDHVLHIMNHIHLQPKDSHGTDFSRVRHWSLNGWAKYYRQTLIFSSLILPEINSIFNKKCFNYAGKVKVVNEIQFGSIGQVFVQLPHVFQKINVNSVEHSIDARFDFFINKILPQQRDPLMKQTMIYVASYFDYVKIRNYFKKEDIGFVQICEYSKEAKIARARDIFFHGDVQFLLYTERHHFFNRIRIKGIRHIVFYQPPTFPHFYYEICNFMQEANMNKKIGSMSNMTVTVLYTKYDAQQLATIVSTERAAKMIQSEKTVHMLVTDGN
nr:digestive organ expansion factor homolog [Onthophagus taurus]